MRNPGPHFRGLLSLSFVISHSSGYNTLVVVRMSIVSFVIFFCRNLTSYPLEPPTRMQETQGFSYASIFFFLNRHSHARHAFVRSLVEPWMMMNFSGTQCVAGWVVWLAAWWAEPRLCLVASLFPCINFYARVDVLHNYGMDRNMCRDCCGYSILHRLDWLGDKWMHIVGWVTDGNALL